MAMRTTLWFVCALAACGGSAGGGGGGGGDDVQAMPDAPPSTTGTWTPLITKSWTLAPQGEDTNDLEIMQVEREIVIGGMRPIDPPGTHHTLLYRGVSSANAIFASGVGTGELIFPPGKGLRLTPGTYLGLQLHIYNTSDDPLSGTSGIEILEVDPASITEEVDLFLPGPEDLDIQPGVSTKVGTCTVNATQNLFALFPHMHQWGVHFKTTLTIGGVAQVLHDESYDFEHQAVKSFTPITVNAGDTITTECTWNNDTNAAIGYGESSDTEMCYSLLYRYPKQNDEFCND